MAKKFIVNSHKDLNSLAAHNGWNGVYLGKSTSLYPDGTVLSTKDLKNLSVTNTQKNRYLDELKCLSKKNSCNKCLRYSLTTPEIGISFKNKKQLNQFLKENTVSRGNILDLKKKELYGYIRNGKILNNK